MNQDMSALPTMVEYTTRLREIYSCQKLVQPYPVTKPDFISMPFLAGIFFVLDLRTGHYLYLTESFPDDMKNSYEAMRREGFSHLISMVHKNDHRIIFDDMFKKRLQFMQTIPKEEQGNYCYTHNYRMITDNNTYKHVLQHMIISETDDFAMPLVISGVCVDISMYKTDTKIIDTVSQLKDKETARVIYEDCYFPDEQDVAFLTHRELEIIQLIAKGKNTKEIADNLNISYHTVKTHRRNIREKTQTSNTAQLIAFGKKKGVV